MTELDKLIKLEALKVEVEGMKAENSKRLSLEYTPAYDYEHFSEKADEMRALLDEPEADGDLLPDGMYYVSSGRLNFIGRTAVVDNTGVPIAEFYKEDTEAEKIVYYLPFATYRNDGLHLHDVAFKDELLADKKAHEIAKKLGHQWDADTAEFTLAD